MMRHFLALALAVGALPISMIRSALRTFLTTSTGLTQRIASGLKRALIGTISMAIVTTATEKKYLAAFR
jgi:hypothetical protein